jgi:hypothetical protein
MNFQQGAEQKAAHLGMPAAGVAHLVMKVGLKVCYGSGYGVRGIEGRLGWAAHAEWAALAHAEWAPQAEGRMNFQRGAE